MSVLTLAEAAAWRDAAFADGWTITPTYPGHEAANSAATLKRDGFVAQVLTRAGDRNGSVCAWGPDGLAIRVPVVYDFAEITAGLRRCQFCNAEGVETEQVGFAGRCCGPCLPEVRKRVEFPGWTR